MEPGKKMRAPTKEQVYHDKNTYKHRCEALEYDLAMAIEACERLSKKLESANKHIKHLEDNYV